MITVKIEVYAKTDSEIEDALERAVKLVQEGYTSGGEHYEDRGYSIDVDGAEEPAEEMVECPECGYEWGSSGEDDPCPECGHVASEAEEDEEETSEAEPAALSPEEK